MPSTPEPEEENEAVVVKDESISDVKSIMMDMMNEPSQMLHENPTAIEEEHNLQDSHQSANGKSDEGRSRSNSSTPEPPGPWNYDENEDPRTYAKSGGCVSLRKLRSL